MIFWFLADPFISLPIAGLCGISLFLLVSTTPELLAVQALFFLIGLFLLYIFTSIDFRIWTKFSWLIYVFSILLLLVSLISPVVRGASRWISVAGWRMIQPSEVIKPLIIVFFAQLISRYQPRSITNLLKLILCLLPVVILIFLQPDLGNFIVYLTFFIFMIITGGLPISYILAGLFLMISSLPFSWFFLQPYQKARLFSFINPYGDPSGAGYNALQAMITIGSGQLLGLGLGRGTQSRLLFLPEYHTDFVFASLGEELGFIGGFIVIVLYLLLLFRILKIAIESDDLLGKLICTGVFSQIFIQVAINIGMNLGLLPITGITLPLLSYGGSSVISTFIGLGLVLSVARQKDQELLVIK